MPDAGRMVMKLFNRKSETASPDSGETVGEDAGAAPDPKLRPRPSTLPENAPRGFHLLAKPAGAQCNLDCDYCFFLSKEMLYPNSRLRMSDSTLEEYLRQLIESHLLAPEVVVAWQGGEPTLMGLDFFRRSVEIVNRYLRPGQKAVHTIQTNGTRLDAEWAAFFKENDFLVGISIDGPKEIHDTYRVTRGQTGSFDQVMRGLDALKAAEVDWNALTTVNAANAARGREVYCFLRDELGATFAQFIPIVERVSEAEVDGTIPWSTWRDRPLYTQDGGFVTGRSITGEGYGRFLIDVFEEWVRHDIGRVYVQMFDVALANYYGAPPSLCIHAETCGTALAIEHNGDLYSCDHFVEPDYLLGNIHEKHMLDLVASPKQRELGCAKRDTLPKQCRQCDVRFACHGGCPKDRFITTADGEPGLNFLCDGYMAFFHHIDEPMKRMCDLLKKQRPPAEIGKWYRQRDRRLGSRGLCTCGSGRPLRQCHGRPLARAVETP